MTIGYAYQHNVIIIVDYIFSIYMPTYEPFKVNGKIIDMYNMLNPNQKYFRIGSQKNKYKINTDTPNRISIFRAVRILNAGFSAKKNYSALLIKEFLNSI